MLQDIIDEFNPRKDVERGLPDFKRHYNENLSKNEQLLTKLDTYSKTILRFLKPFVRGQIYGGAIGALYGYLSNNDISSCINEGRTLGWKIDLLQYNVRIHIHLPHPSDFLNK